MNTIGDTVSRVRNIIKGVKEDAFLTDRLIYSVVLKYAKFFIRRQDNEGKIMRFQSLFETLPCIELIELDKVPACCSGIKSGCTIRRTRNKLPAPLEGSIGPLFRDVSSVDGSIKLYQTYPSTFVNISNSTNFKYNKNKYYWYLDGYMYFPNLDWDAVNIDAIWADDIQYLKCLDTDNCTTRQQQSTHIPDYLLAEIEQLVLKELGLMLQIPMDNKDDNQSIARS